MIELMILAFIVTMAFLTAITLTTQAIEADYDGKHIVVGGGDDWRNYCVQRKVKTGVTVYPGRFVSNAGETDPDVDLAAAGDGDTGGLLLVIERTGVKAQNIDTGITEGQYVMCMRPTGGKFKVLCWKADAAAAILMGQLMTLEASGMLTKYVEVTTAATTAADIAGRAAIGISDTATTDKIMELHY